MPAKGFVFAILMLLSGPALAEELTASPSPSRPGPTIPGTSSIDPSENVKALNEAATKRQDDLRAAESSANALRYEHLKEVMALRADYEDKLRNAEAKRIDAIRLVDSNSISVANERAVATATALAKTVQDSAQVLSSQVTKSADDQRQLVSTTAAESNRNLQQKFEDIGKRISSLEQAGAEGVGKQKLQDPAQLALTAAVQKLIEAQSSQSGTGTGRGEVIAWVVGGIMLLIAIIGSIVVVATFVTRSKATRR